MKTTEKIDWETSSPSYSYVSLSVSVSPAVAVAVSASIHDLLLSRICNVSGSYRYRYYNGCPMTFP